MPAKPAMNKDAMRVLCSNYSSPPSSPATARSLSTASSPSSHELYLQPQSYLLSQRSPLPQNWQNYRSPSQDPDSHSTRSLNAWAPMRIVRRTTEHDPFLPETVDRKVKGLLNKLATENFDSISDQIIMWGNQLEKEKDGRTLIQVIRLVFEKATDEAAWSAMYARLCRKLMDQISSKVQDDGIKNREGKPIAGGQLFRKYLLNRCQEDFERGWVAKEATAAAAATKSIKDEAAKAANDKRKEGGGGEVVLYSDEYYAAQKAKRQGLGLIKFIGELFKLQMLTERIMHECVKKLLGNVGNPEEEEIESLCKLLSTVGGILDTQKARTHMDAYFSRIKDLARSPSISKRLQFMLLDVIELRERRWTARSTAALLSTPTQFYRQNKSSQDKEFTHHRASTYRSVSRYSEDWSRNVSRQGSDDQNLPGVLAIRLPRPSAKADGFSNLDDINRTTQARFNSAANEGSGETISRTSTSSYLVQLQMLNQSSNATTEVDGGKPGHPAGRKRSVDLYQGGIPELTQQQQRKKLMLQPRSRAVEALVPAVGSDRAKELGEATNIAEAAPPGMPEADAERKTTKDAKMFFYIRNLDKAEKLFTELPPVYHSWLVNKLVSSAVDSEAADVKLVSDFFARAALNGLCSPAAFEEGFIPVAEILGDIAAYVLKAFAFMARMIGGSDIGEERYIRVAQKSKDSQRLLDLLSMADLY